MARIFIDPGHGGDDNGAKYGYHEEDDYNLAVAFLLDCELRLRGINTKLSRTDDSAISLQDRVKLAREFEAAAFVSIHCDAWHRETVSGFSTHVYRARPNHLGSYVHLELRQALNGHKDRGLTESNFYVLRRTPMPAALVECEFISNPETARFLKEPANQRLIARAIAAGVTKYLTK